ncbi:cation/H(+) antiporter 15-like [Rutidosis leptorrhynchoides]|uniref:cation/H(+) antiporter 15-like n=1 Tax=Rutidosis leptorrhynchoides TaxID=125765 RepID=UPI003A9927B6
MGLLDKNITEVAGVVAQNPMLVCVKSSNKKFAGVFYGDTPFAYSTPVLLMQLSVAAFFTAVVQRILTPLGETAFISQMLVGIAMGPSFLGTYAVSFIRTLYPGFSIYVNETFALFGCMLYMFLVGVRMDLGMVKRSGKKAAVIGVSSFFVPLMINTILSVFVVNIESLDPAHRKSVPFIAAFQSLSSFHVIACLLADLKLLNSELGRLASCASMISGICSWIWIIITFAAQQSLMARDRSFVWMVLCVFALVFLIVCVLRPILLCIIRHIPESRAVKEGHMYSIFLMILFTSLISEVIGQHFMFGPMVLGMALPDGPPLGSALVDKLELYISSILLPSYFVFSGSKLNISLIPWRTFGVVEFLSLSGFVGKLLGAMVPALYSNMPVVDAFSLGLIMSAQGIADVLVLQQSTLLRLVDRQSFTSMLVSMVLLTGIITPIIKILYKPSKRYMSQRRRTIQHADTDSELRILACIHHQDNTPSIIELLRISNPTPRNPICFYVLHLMELVGRSAPLLIFHRPDKRQSLIYSSETDHIINAFRSFEQENPGSVLVNLLTAVSPYASMHDEICMLAADKRVSLVIVPFHEHWTLHGTEDQLPRQVRSVNINVLRMAPCSVGILVDRGTLTGYKPTTLYSIVIVFISGPDDREALAYAMRMGEHLDVALTMVRIVEPVRSHESSEELELDDESINDFRIANVGKRHHAYREEVAVDSVEMVSVLRSLRTGYDLIFVGRRHRSSSPLFTGLTEWSEFPELGHIGDMLASSDLKCQISVLVVQQQLMFGADNINPFFDDPIAIDMSRNNSKVFPN